MKTVIVLNSGHKFYATIEVPALTAMIQTTVNKGPATKHILSCDDLYLAIDQIAAIHPAEYEKKP